MMSSRWVISNSVKRYRRALPCLLATTALGNGVAYSQQAPQTALTDSIAEVIVTASKMAENNQVVPIAVTALTADALAAKGITNVADLGRNVPNVSFDAGVPFGGSNSVLAAYIRGIGQDDFAFNLDPGVGIYIDGVYLARSVGANASMLDVDRVEVLKGPQGTLFGRNSIGGAVSIITHDPSDTFNYRAEVTGGSFGRLDIQGRVDIPLSDTVRTSLAFSEVHSDGYQRRIPYPGAVAGSSGIPDCDALAAGTNCVVTYDPLNGTPQAGYQSGTRQGGDNQWTVRGKIAFVPSDDFRATVSTDYTNVNQQAVANTVLNISPNTPGALGGIYNACLLGITVPFNQVCTSPRLGLSPVPVASNPLPALAGLNVNGNPNDNRLPLDGRYIIPGSVRVVRHDEHGSIRCEEVNGHGLRTLTPRQTEGTSFAERYRDNGRPVDHLYHGVMMRPNVVARTIIPINEHAIGARIDLRLHPRQQRHDELRDRKSLINAAGVVVIGPIRLLPARRLDQAAVHHYLMLLGWMY